MHTRSRWTYGLIALLLLLAFGLAFAAPIDPGSRKADPAAKYISRAVEDRNSPLYAGPGEPTAAALQARGQPSLIGPLPRRDGKPVMPALVRIGSQAAIAKMRAMGCFVGAVVGDIATARIPVDKLDAVAQMPEVKRLRYAPRRELLLDVSVPEVNGDLLHDIGVTGQGVIVGVVDTGIDWQHEDFINFDGTSRILYIWDQTDPMGPAPPPPFDYGTLWTKADIDAALGGGTPVSQVDWIGHGTHVAGIAASNGRAPGGFIGMAPLADLIVVHAPFDTDAGATDQELIDGNAFIAQTASDLARPVVINNSWGGHFGEPHDGYGEVEMALSDLADQGVVVVASAGNDGESFLHAGTSIDRTRGYQWHFWVAPPFGYMSAAMAVDIWYPPDTELEFSVAYDWEPDQPDPPPPAPPIPCLTQQTDPVLTGSSNGPDGFTVPPESTWADAVIYIDATDVNEPGVDPSDYANHALIYIDMTAGFSFSPLGIVVNLISGDPSFDAWSAAATIYDIPYPYLTGCMIDPLPGFFIPGDNLKTVSPPSTGDEIISVGSYNTKCSYLDRDETEQDLCALFPVESASYFTSRGPRRDNVRKPDISAPGAVIASALSLDHDTGLPLNPNYTANMLTPDGEHVVIQGTSMSSPHVAGAVALMLEKDPFLTPDAVKHFLLLTARPGNLFRSGWDPVWGWGRLDARAAADLVQETAGPGDPRETEVGVDFTTPIASITVEYGIAETNWPVEFSGIAFDESMLEPFPIPLDNMEILQNHWALNNPVIRIVLRADDVRIDPDGSYNFYKVDPLIQAVVDAGAKPMICVCELPPGWTNWQAAAWFHMVANHFAEEHDLSGWYWQILDLADLQNWEPLRPRWDPWEYMLMFNQVYESLKQAAPNSKVGGPGLSQYDDLYVEDLLRAVRAIDFISWHAEGATTVPRGNPSGVLNAALNTVAKDIDRAAAMIARWKAGVEIVIDAYNVNAWRPVRGEFFRTVEADPRLGEAAGAAWNVAALRELILSAGGNSALLAVLQDATDGVLGPDDYSTPGSGIFYEPFQGRGLWPVDAPTSRSPTFFAQFLFNYYFPKGSQIVQAYSSDPFVSVLAASTGDPAVNVAVINTSPWQVTTQLALAGLPYYEGVWYTVDDFSAPGYAMEPTFVDSIQTVDLEPYAVRILSVRDIWNLLKTPGLDVGGSVKGDRSVARDWVSHDGLRHPETYAMSTQTKHSGYASQAIIAGTTTGGGSIWQQTAIGSVSPGAPYEISAYVRPLSVVPTSGGGAFVRVEFLDQFAQPLSPRAIYQSTRLSGTAGFQKLRVLDGTGQPQVVAPAAARCLRVDLVLAASGGRAFFDRAYAGRSDIVPETLPGGTIMGTVRAQDFSPIAGAKVSLQEDDYFAYTRSDGTYQIDFVPEDVYTVVAGKDGYQTSTSAGHPVFDGQETQVDFILRRVGGLLRISEIAAETAQVEPGEQDIAVTMFVDCMTDKQVRLSEVGLRFWSFDGGYEDISDEYTVAANPANPKTLLPRTIGNVFRFLVSVKPGAATGEVLIDGFISGYLNLVPNGSFEAGSEVPPAGWIGQWDDSEITRRIAYAGTRSHRGWFWKDESPVRGWIESLNPIPVQGNSFYRIGFAYTDQQLLGQTDLFYYINEYDDVGNLLTWTGLTLDHASMSQLTVCKHDAAGRPIPGWTFMLNGTEYQTDAEGCVTMAVAPGRQIICERVPQTIDDVEYDDPWGVTIDGQSVTPAQDPSTPGVWCMTKWLLREGLYRMQPDTRSVLLQIGMQDHELPSPFPLPEAFTADFWVDDVFVEPDSPVGDTGSDIPGFWEVVGQVQSLTLDAGWNMISLPGDPVDPDPEAVFAGIPIDYTLYRYDGGARGYVAYSSEAPGEFGACRAGEGYWLYLGAPAVVRYASTGTRGQQITVGRPGWSMVGLPRLEPASVSTCLVDSGAGVLAMPEAVTAGWVALPMYFYQSDAGGYATCGMDVPLDDDTLRPWVGYWLYSNSPSGSLVMVP